jgi:hypothetical protein
MNRLAIILAASVSLLGSDLAFAGGAHEPMYTTSAETGSRIEGRLGVERFSDVELDEVDSFDGWGATAEASMPFGGRFRLRLVYPFKTDGDATIKDDQPASAGENVDIEGNGGVYEFLTLTLEHQLFFAADRGYNLAYYVGGGTKADRLETTKYDPWDKTYDVFNHTGNLFHGGLRFDRQHSFGRVVANIGMRYYWSSDDIYPGGNKDSFAAADFRAAVVFAPWKMIYPVLEVTYFGDFSDLNQLTFIPELIFSMGEHAELKAGASVGLGGTGNQLGGQAQVVVYF